MPRYLYITEARYLREEWADPMLLVEDDDGTFRRPTGQDLLELDRLFPGFLGDSHLTAPD